jgi:hypothetical protein
MLSASLRCEPVAASSDGTRRTLADQRVIGLYNVYIHGDMPRRDFLHRLAGIASCIAATAQLSLIECN